MWENPLTFFDYLSVPFLVSNFAVLSGFFLSALFAWSYTKGFYEGREKPKSWLLIVAGLTAMVLSETGQFLLPYRVSPPVEIVTAILMVQNIGVIFIATGCYLLFRETL